MLPHNFHVNPGATKNLPAFMLIEIMIAFALMCCIALLIAQYQASISKNRQLARDTAQATAIASSAIEDLLRNSDEVAFLMNTLGKFTVTKEFNKIEKQLLEKYQLCSQFLKTVASACIKVTWKDQQNIVHELVLHSVVPSKGAG